MSKLKILSINTETPLKLPKSKFEVDSIFHSSDKDKNLIPYLSEADVDHDYDAIIFSPSQGQGKSISNNHLKSFFSSMLNHGIPVYMMTPKAELDANIASDISKHYYTGYVRDTMDASVNELESKIDEFYLNQANETLIKGNKVSKSYAKH